MTVQPLSQDWMPAVLELEGTPSRPELGQTFPFGVRGQGIVEQSSIFAGTSWRVHPVRRCERFPGVAALHFKKLG
jgi:hypothetical protein